MKVTLELGLVQVAEVSFCLLLERQFSVES